MDAIDNKDMPEPDQIVRYHDGFFGPAMFHYLVEGVDGEAYDLIARDHGFEISNRRLECDDDAGDAWRAYEKCGEARPDSPSMEEVLALWKPKKEGWKLVGMHDTEDGPVSVFIRPTEKETDRG